MPRANCTAYRASSNMRALLNRSAESRSLLALAPLLTQFRLKIETLPVQIVTADGPQTELCRPNLRPLQILSIGGAESRVGGIYMSTHAAEVDNRPILPP